jgi:hypothetical protein
MANRTWCAIAQFPDKHQFYFGTIVIPTNAKQHDIETEMFQQMATIFPTNPRIINLIPGQLIFQGEK